MSTHKVAQGQHMPDNGMTYYELVAVQVHLVSTKKPSNHSVLPPMATVKSQCITTNNSTPTAVYHHQQSERQTMLTDLYSNLLSKTKPAATGLN